MSILNGNPVAIVTGASRGIGRATALKLASEGARVVVNYFNSEKAALEVVQQIKDKGVKAMAVKADVAIAADVKRLCDETVKAFGTVDILVNNAGSIPRPGDWKNITEEVWQRTLDINLKSVFQAIQTSAPYMLQQKHGRIINIASAFGIWGLPNTVAYCAAKAGVINLTTTFAKALAPYVTINSIAPGFVKTDMTPPGEDFTKWVQNNTPLKRFAQPEEIADIATFFASEAAAYVTGQTLIVDGGYTLK